MFLAWSLAKLGKHADCLDVPWGLFCVYLKKPVCALKNLVGLICMYRKKPVCVSEETGVCI
jgi:hypothetical protein